jgi:hypothetical protein
MTDLEMEINCKKYKCPCLNKRYCGPVCQQSDWNSGHKNECRQTLGETWLDGLGLVSLVRTGKGILVSRV